VYYLCDTKPVSVPVVMSISSLIGVGVIVAFIYSIILMKRERSIVVLWLSPVACILLLGEVIESLAMMTKHDAPTLYFFRLFVDPYLYASFVIQMFEIVVLVYSKRGVNIFGCLKFERANNQVAYTRLRFIRYSLWMYLLMTVGLAYVNAVFTLQDIKALDSDSLSNVCFCGPFYYFISKPATDSLPAGPWKQSLEMATDSILLFTLVISSTYFGLLLWNYGTTYSFGVYSCWFNPWVISFVSAVIGFGVLWTPRGLILLQVFVALIQFGIVLTSKLAVSEMKFGASIEEFLASESSLPDVENVDSESTDDFKFDVEIRVSR